ncbi:MAG: hypothetical protein ABJA02_12045 [Acidobacteriota bacterium]
MSEATAVSKTVGRTGALLAFVGVCAFFFGIFGQVRYVMFGGILLIILSFAAFFIEEFGPRR